MSHALERFKWARAGGAASKVPALQPVDSDVLAAWKNEYVAGDFGSNGMQLKDYSGNGWDLDVVNGFLSVPDIVPGRLTQFAWLTNHNSQPNPLQLYSGGGTARGLYRSGSCDVFDLVGDLTLTVRVAQSGQQGAFAAYQYIYSHGDFVGSKGASFGLGVEKDGYRFFVYWERPLPTFTSQFVYFSAGISQRIRSSGFQHAFVSCVRDSTAKTLRLGVDGVYETQPYAQQALPQTGRKVFVGATPSVSGAQSDVMGFCGLVTNPVIRTATRTDAQLEIIRAKTMGL